MPDPTKTIRDDLPPGPPAAPAPVRLGALRRLLNELGPKEKDGRNWGEFIRRMGAYFLSRSRLQSFAPGQVNEGKLLWCALTVCGFIYEELLGRGQTELASHWKRIASTECSKLWRNLDSLGWAWRRGAPLPAALSPQGVDVPGLPAAGDLVFYGQVKADGSLDFAHVDFYKAPLAGDDFESAGGNTGHPVADRVDVVKHRGPEKLGRVIGYARVPW